MPSLSLSHAQRHIQTYDTYKLTRVRAGEHTRTLAHLCPCSLATACHNGAVADTCSTRCVLGVKKSCACWACCIVFSCSTNVCVDIYVLLMHIACHIGVLADTFSHSCPMSRTPCNTLQCTATHCNALEHTAMHCNTLQCTATHCNALQHTAMHCNTLQNPATHCSMLRRTATHCNTLQRTVTH